MDQALRSPRTRVDPIHAPILFCLRRARRSARLGVVLLGLPLIACQTAVGAPDAPQARLGINTSTVAATTGQPRGTSNLTYTVHRGTIRDSLNIPGRVVPAQSAQIVLQSSGTISAIDVRAGQTVTKGDALIEVSVDDGVLEAARTRARLADLEYDTQQARVDTLQRGTGTDLLVAATAEVAKAQAGLRKAQIQRDAAAQPDPARAAAKDAADRQVAVAELAVQNANDELGDAQTGVTHVQALIQQAQAEAKSTAQADADSAATRLQTASTDARLAASATKTAQRKLDEATAALGDAQAGPNLTKVRQDVAAQQNQVALTQEALHDAQATADGLDGSKDPTGVIAAAAVSTVRSAGRDLGHQLDHLQLLQVAVDPAKQTDARLVLLAQLQIDQAKDDLVQAQANEQQANQDLQRTRDGAAVTRLSNAELLLDLPAAQARVRAAERKIREENLHLEQARSASQPPDTSAQDDLRQKTADADLQIAQAGLDEAQSRLASLQQPTAADEIAREVKRAALLQDAANAAHAAVQPTVVALAPFDGTVSTINVGLGQLVDARTIAAQLAGVGTLSVKASATETDVTGLSLNQTVAVAFPSLGDNITASGKVLEISGAASTPTAPGANSTVTYPVTVELGSVPPALKLGMTATLNVDLRTAQDVLYVPSNAIRTVDSQTLATTVSSNGQLADTPIQTGPSFGSNVQVLSGLNEGDVVTVFASTVGATVASTKQQ